LHDIAIFEENRLIDFATVDERAVATLQVLEENRIAVSIDLGVISRDRRIFLWIERQILSGWRPIRIRSWSNVSKAPALLPSMCRN